MKKSLSICHRIPFFLLIVAITVGQWGCSSPTNPKYISEGVIEYKATPVDPDNSMAALAPSKMLVKFKDNFCAAEMTAGMGLFTTSFVSDPKRKTFTHMVKLINQKFAVIMGPDSIKNEVDADPKPIIQKMDETKKIAGYTCKKAHVTYANNAQAPFDIWYTKELNIENPNWSNPYHEIDGVLMEYQLKRYGLELRFNAISVSKASIDESIFSLPSEYKIISRQEMAKKFQDF
jgi:GLPGLI family protein